VVRIPEGAVTIVAGRPSHGKTTVLLNLLANLLRSYPEQRFAFFSYEEARSRLALKLIMILADQVLRNGDNQAATLELLQGEAAFNNQAVEAAKQEFGAWTSSGRLLLSDKRLVAEDLAGTIGHLHEEQGLGGCLVDYIQKISVLRPASQRYLDVKRASELLLEQAVRTNVPLVLGAQLGRPAGGKSGSAVRLDNLRESGDIEQDANVVLGIWNKAVNVDVEAEQDEVEKEWRGADSDLMVAVLKNRNGRAGVKEYLAFNRDTLRLSAPSSFQGSTKRKSSVL
jgi:replicative DNA helicase